MIEQFTPEQIEIIKKELGISDKTKASKRYILAAEHTRILNITQEEDFTKKDAIDCWYAVCALCDHALRNYYVYGHPIEIRQRYQTIWYSIQEPYKKMANEIIDIFEKYRKKGLGYDNRRTEKSV